MAKLSINRSGRSSIRRWVIACSLGVALGATALALTPELLRCEYRTNPMGIGVDHPRLSWVLEGDPARRGERQTAYQIIVASSLELLQQDRGDLWDTGKIPSDETIGIPYNGIPLASNQRCYWKVRVWNEKDEPSAWSKPAFWSMGLLHPSDWKAQWIGLDKPRQSKATEPPFQGASWIWFAGDTGAQKPAATRVFLGDFDLPAKGQIQTAELWITADNECWVNLNGRQILHANNWENPNRLDVTSLLKPGHNQLRIQVRNASPGPAGLLAKLIVKFQNGQTFVRVTDASWRATDRPGANWHNRPISPQAWPAVAVLGPYGMKPWGRLRSAEVFTPPAVYLRTRFYVKKPVKTATLYATALGWYDTYLNGQRVNDSYFNPGWTDYRKRVYYRAFDVTSLIRQGENAWGAVLSDGWYSGYIGWGHKREHYGKKPRFLGQLIIEYQDGTRQIVCTGPDWKGSTGPIVAADILMGETYDARREMPGWDKPGFEARGWMPVDVGAELHPVLQPHPGPEVKVVGRFKPKKITQPKPGVWVIDLGQNFAGVVQLRVKGKPGQRIQIRHAERLNPDGTIYTKNLRSARATDVYICRGDGIETWSPRFTFHGFQYVELTGLTEPPTQDTITGLALSSATPVVGDFECSDPMLNQLHSNIFWTQRANFIDVPTDCPQRDERLGWTGDAQIYIRTATLNCDVQAFFTKWLVDLEDAQRPDGQFPCVAPLVVAGDDGGPAWADAGVICPWTIYEVYGDRRLLAQHYDAMKRYIAFCKNRCTPDLLPPKQFHCFGDWLNVHDPTPKDVIYTAYFAYSTMLTAKAAEALGRTDEARKYWDLYNRIRAAFNRTYVDQNGRIKGNSQTAYVLAIAFDLVQGKRLQQAAQHLIERIRARDWHLSTGFIGTKDLMLVLAKIGRNDVAYRLIHNDTYPSWGFSIKHGATTIWERWDGWTPEKGFQDPGMNSFAHYSFGAVYQWMVENIGGIRNDGPSYKHLIIKPYPDGKLTWARVAYHSIRGLIQTHWERHGDRLTLDVLIPPNTSAIVYIPTDDPTTVRESGRPLSQAPGVQPIPTRRTPHAVAVRVGSGLYHFESRYTPPPMP